MKRKGVGIVLCSILMIMPNVTLIQLNTRERERERRLAGWPWTVGGWARAADGRGWRGGSAVEL
jgi:hypothetical protein